MRAIISCTTRLSNKEIVTVLDEINWLPNICVDGKENELRFIIRKQKESIFKTIPDEKETTLKNTTFVTIYDGETKTWGIVTRTNKYRITFRLKNPQSYKLKKACESLVKELRLSKPRDILEKANKTADAKKNNTSEDKNDITNEAQKNNTSEDKNDITDEAKKNNTFKVKTNITNEVKPNSNEKLKTCVEKNEWKIFREKSFFKFASYIHVLEKDSDHESFTGIILKENFLYATIAENSYKAWVVVFTLIITIGLFFITSPICDVLYNGIWLIPNHFFLSEDWGNWINGILGRVSTATLVTGLLGAIELYWYWYSLKKSSPIKWIAE
jgi:hypothetical protein